MGAGFVLAALDAAKHREAVIEEYENRCGPLFVCGDIFVVCPRMAELHRASPTVLRSAHQQIKQHLAPASTSGLEDVLSQGSDVPSDGTSLLLMTAQFPGPGTRAERVATESVDCILLSRAPRLKYKYLLPSGAAWLSKLIVPSRERLPKHASSCVRRRDNCLRRMRIRRLVAG